VSPERLVCLVFDRSLGEGRGEGLELRDTLSEPTANIGLEVMSIPLAVEKVAWSLVSRDPSWLYEFWCPSCFQRLMIGVKEPGSADDNCVCSTVDELVWTC
jgi:hypothetical protein